jgi:hypothetical protein
MKPCTLLCGPLRVFLQRFGGKIACVFRVEVNAKQETSMREVTRNCCAYYALHTYASALKMDILFSEKRCGVVFYKIRRTIQSVAELIRINEAHLSYTIISFINIIMFSIKLNKFEGNMSRKT